MVTIIVTCHKGLLSKRDRRDIVRLLNRSAGRIDLLDSENVNVLLHQVTYEDRLCTKGLGADVVINVIGALPPHNVVRDHTVPEGLKALVTPVLGSRISVKVEVCMSEASFVD